MSSPSTLIQAAARTVALARFRRSWLVIIMAAVALAVPVASAGACSCAGGDPRVRLSGADAAFAGTVTSKRRVTGFAAPRMFDYVFAVEKSYKGSLGATVAVRAPADDGTCGLDLREGARIGLLLREDDGRWTAGLCDVIQPGELEEAIQPYPRGSGSGLARLLVTGTFHDAGLAALAADGSLIGWSFGGEGDTVGVCPGGRYAAQAGDWLSIIRLRDLRVVQRRPLPQDWTHAVECLDDRGRDVVAVTFPFGESFERQTLVRVRGDGTRILATEHALQAVLGATEAYFSPARREAGTRLLAIRYRDGRRRSIGPRRRPGGLMALSPDGRRIAAIEDYRRPRLRVTDVRTGRNRSRRVDAEWTAPVWVDAGRVAVAARRGRAGVFNLRLRRVNSVPSWEGPLAAAAGDRLWWVTRAGRVESLDVRSGASISMAGVRLVGARGIEPLARGGAIRRAPRRAPRVTGTSATCAKRPTGP